MSKTFKQYDSRWGRHPYPSLPYTMAGAGCGPTAVADIVVNNPKYKNITPDKTRKYMIKQGYATRGHGTTWEGIYKTLKHYGFIAGEHDTMTGFFEQMAKKNRWGILLFGSGTRGGVTWTGGGHYIAVTAYKKKNGKHYLYTRDPGPRGHDGWYCYETTMKGLIKTCWTCYLPEKKAKKPEKKPTKKPTKPATKPRTPKTYPGTFPKLPKRGYFKQGDEGRQVKRLQKFLIWAGYSCGKSGADGKFGPATRQAVLEFQYRNHIKTDGKFGPESLAKAKTIKRL